MAKGIRVPIPSRTHGRAVKRLFRVFVDLGGKKHVASMGGNKYPIIIGMISRAAPGCTSFPTNMIQQVLLRNS